jgi:LEA14-like dessication related protein
VKIFSGICILFFLIQAGCSDSIKVTVELDNQKHRQVYLEHLKDSGLNYSINSDGSFEIKVESLELLKEKMKGFDEFVAKENKDNNKH